MIKPLDTYDIPPGINLLQVESITNHDVKAIEYIIKERIAHNAELAKVTLQSHTQIFNTDPPMLLLFE